MKQSLANLKSLKKIFWDVDIFSLNLSRNSKFIIERVLEHGDEKAVQWMQKTFPKAVIASVARTSRRLSLKSKNFWRIKLNLCQSKRSAKKPSKIWKY